MKITRVEVRNREKENSRMKAVASVTLDDCFVVMDIKLIQLDDKMIIRMPSKKYSDDDVAHPINQETRKMFEDAIFQAYNEMKEKSEEQYRLEF